MEAHVRRILIAAPQSALALLLMGGLIVLEAQTFPEEIYAGLEWDNIGPARGGRSTAVAGSVARPLEYYFGATGGGLWKTTDAGQNWAPVTDGQITTASIGAVAVCEADPDIVYIGGGETEIRGNIQQGDGLYKSTDAGETWTHIGLRETQNISRIRVHPENCGTLWVAAFGKHSIANPERGVFKSTDGGDNWEKVLYTDDRSGAVDISIDPNNPDVMYAALWEAWRKSWGASSGGLGSGLYKSTDGGDSWEELTRNKEGLPDGIIGKIGVAVSPANPDRVWALIEHPEGGVFRSDDAGETWTRINEERRLRQRAFYYTRIYADPQDADVVYALNTGMYRSEDGGETYTQIRVPHGDNHDLWIASNDPARMINANDGGGNVSVNGGDTWTDQDFSTAQFYRVTTTNHEPYHICGAQQDNSTACVPSQGWNHLSRAAGTPDFLYTVGGCESGYIAPHPTNTDIFYAGCYGGQLERYDHSTGQERAVQVWPENPMGQSSEDLVERVQWTFPIVFSHHDPNVLYTGTQKLWRTLTEGQNWEQLSEDVTRAAQETMGASGGPITKDQTGVETYATLFAIAPSYHDPAVIWTGSDDGVVQITRDGGESWKRVTPPDAPDFVRINTIEASPNTPGKAYVAGIRYLVDDDRSPYIWKTEDYGETWSKVVNGIPEDDFIRAVREDPTRPGLLYAASERTVYISWDDGANWQSLGLNLPTLQVSDLVVKENDLVIGTHGRSFWVLRNIEPLRQMNAEVAAADSWVFGPADPIRGVENRVTVNYYLSEDAENIEIAFLDSRGEVVQSYEGTPEDEAEDEGPPRGGGGFGGPAQAQNPATGAGAQSFSWNLRYPSWTDFDGRIFWAARPNGPMAVPGAYQVRVTIDGESTVRDFEIRMDPRLEGEVTVAQLQERFDFAITIRDRVTDANGAIIQIRDIKTEIDDRLEQTDNQEIEQSGEALDMSLFEVEEEIYQVRNESNQDPLNFPIKLNNKLAALMNQVDGAESQPTDQAREVYQYLSDLLQEELDRLELVITQDLARFNELLRNEGLPPIELGRLIS